MSTTQTANIELEVNPKPTSSRIVAEAVGGSPSSIHDDSEAPSNAVDVIPDGGYGWVVVFGLALPTTFYNGWTGSWGVLQTALLQTRLGASTSALSFVGSLSIALCVAFGLASNRLHQLCGARWSMFIGTTLLSASALLASATTNNLGGLFVTAGMLSGIGGSVTYNLANTVPVQWFSGKLGAANGYIKFGGGVGSAVWAVGFEALIEKVGIAWALRVYGLLAFVSGALGSYLIRERTPARKAQILDFTLFRSLPFCVLFAAGAVCVFCLFVPPYFLPLFAHSIGLSASTGAGIVAAFHVCGAVGRIAAGYACDKLGATNTLLLVTTVNALSMLAIWPVSDTIGPLALFAAFNGLANGAFFVAFPVAIAKNVGLGQAAAGMSMAATGWTVGYLMGSPIAGILIGITGAEQGTSVQPYRAAIFYAGGIATASAACVLFARLRLDKKLNKKL